MTERTEEDKICIAPINVILGGQQYSIEQLRIKDSRGWRKSVVDLIQTMPVYANQAISSKEGDIESALIGLAVTAPDAVIDLFFSYAKDLDRGEIEDIATESEIAVAWEEVSKVAFPLSKTVPETMNKLYQ